MEETEKSSGQHAGADKENMEFSSGQQRGADK